MTFHLYKRGLADQQTFAQNIVFFSPALDADIRQSLFNAIWNVSILPTTPATIEFTLDDGANWFPLTNSPLPANQESVFNITADGNDKFNLRCTDAGGCTIYRAVVSIAPLDIQRRLVDLTSGGALPVDICPVNCDVPVVIQNTPVPVSGTVSLTSLDLILDTIFNQAVAINAEWFTPDIPPTGLVAGQGIQAQIHFAISLRAKISYTIDGGTTWVELNNGFNIEPNTGNVYTIPLIFGDTLNFRSDKALTVIFARVTQS